MVANHSGPGDYVTLQATVPEGKSEDRPAYRQDPIAVVGMACRLPGESNTPKALWDFLMSGGVADCTRVPESRFDRSTHYDGSTKPKTMRSPGGLFLENIDVRDFDAAFFATSNVDATTMDPQQRQLLEVVFECLENSGITLEDLDEAAVACLVGSYSVDYDYMQARDPEDRPPSVTIGVGRAILSNRISHFLNIKGPSMTIDTACSGSLVSLDVACRYLQTGEVSGAIVAGANIYLSPEHVMDSGAMKGAASLSGKCHTFDVKADGYIKAEGVNAVYLKRLSDAVRDGDPIRAVIRGTSTNSDGRTPGIASPSAEAQALAIRAAYANAGITDFNQTSYLEFHGTGTQAGDPTEVKGAASVFASSRDPEKPLYIGSVKSNIGHSEPAAGISGLLKAVLSIENGMIPGNPTFIDPSPKIDFVGSKVSASRVARPWPKAPFKRASVNSFGYGGSNAHVVVEEVGSFSKTLSHVSSFAPDTDDFFGLEESPASGRPYILVLSANDDDSLQANFSRLSSHLLNPKVKVDPSDLAYTLSERRSKLFSRGYIVTNSPARLDAARFVRGKKGRDAPKIGFVFTGQGAQWSQMGYDLVQTFPSAKVLLQSLDEVLQQLPDPPKWRLLDELTQPRSPEALRKPEFSQPLVTALQLVIIEIFQDWGISPQAVVGHSSGEIAAAYAAGLITKAEAIVAAFHRGYASTRASPDQDLSMLAAGISPAEFPSYAHGLEGLVTIACFNSPQSITISGPVSALEQVRTRLTADKKFGRLLQVNLAYHSKFMEAIGEDYLQLLAAQLTGRDVSGNTKMFSSVTGSKMEIRADAEYWRSNMVNAVRFDAALTEMLKEENGPDFLIEIGPSGALSGPIKQIKAAIGDNASHVQYAPALSRGRDAIMSTFDVAGKLFIAGSPINLAAVNQLGRNGEKKPSVLVDLPNYAWNHSTKYWYENDASKDWRYRLFPHHDILGTKVLGASWNEPSFRKKLVLDDLPWLRDHKMGTDIIFPASGFISMAVEAIRQKSQALVILEGKPEIKSPAYRVRDMTFSRALVLEEKKEHKVMLTLVPKTGHGGTWHSYKVSSLVGDVWQENSRGLIKIEEGVEERASSSAVLEPLKFPTEGSLWYKAMNDAGYGFGPAFHKQLQVECVSTKRVSRSTVSLEEPESANTQSPYPLHPAVMDGCFQTAAPALWAGQRSDVNAVLIPAIIDEVLINPVPSTCVQGIAQATSDYVGVGRRDVTKNYKSDSSVYDPETGVLLFQLSGLRYHKLDTMAADDFKHTYTEAVWKPDVTTLHALGQHPELLGIHETSALEYTNQLVDMVAHKKPNLSVLEAVQVTGSSNSVWFDRDSSEAYVRAAFSRYQFTTLDPTDLMSAEESYASRGNTEFRLLDIASAAAPTDEEDKFDLVILKTDSGHDDASVVSNARKFLKGTSPSFLVHIVQSGPHSENGENGVHKVNGTGSLEKTNGVNGVNGVNGTNGINGHLQRDTAASLWRKEYSPSVDSDVRSVSLTFGNSVNEQKGGEINLLYFNEPAVPELKLREKLAASGWAITEHRFPFEGVDPNKLSLVLEFAEPLMPNISEPHWEAIKTLLSSGQKILWVTEGAQMDVTEPSKAMMHGLARTVRAEDPLVDVTLLDVENAAGPATFYAVTEVLRKAQEDKPKLHRESEYVERGGVINICRILPSPSVNQAEDELWNGAEEIDVDLHEANTTIRLQSERIGTLEQLHFQEVAPTELPLEENKLEVEIFAAGLNFKDLAVTMGIVPENEHLLGLEGGGIVRRVHPSVTRFKPGDRVIVFEKGTFANRIILTTERTHHIPDNMSFEDIATLASVYLTSLYSIYDLANTQKGHRVLIHSASGGLGQASIQICQYIGAEIFATVGNDEKKTLLMDKFGIPASHIFNSRTTGFGKKLMQATNGAGVDVIINTLTEDLLDESWRCISTGGTMVELGKKDLLDRNLLSMEPFQRNASYRAFDLSHICVTDQLIDRLLRQMMTLLFAGHIKPIGPMKTFPFTDIPGAFRYMRGGTHVGKIVITNGPAGQPKVKARPAPKKLALREDVSYLIVGGLKGLCGTMAVNMARRGAKHLVVLSRSGCGDAKSQAALQNIRAYGGSVTDIQGDASKEADVRRCFDAAPRPVAGIIQGAMVLRDRVFTAMSIDDYRVSTEAKFHGTWHLHNIAEEKGLPLDFFALFSSISGVVGQRGQANYAAANVFLDNFAQYRRRLGRAACSVDLGAIEDIGYFVDHQATLRQLDPLWARINEQFFTRIFGRTLLQDLHRAEAQQPRAEDVRAAQLITTIAVPQPEGSRLLADARFSALDFGRGGSGGSGGGGRGGDDAAKAVQALFMLVDSGAAQAAVLRAALELANRQMVQTLRLGEPMEPSKPLASYGMDSLAAVEFRNWARQDLKAELTTLEIANATSLHALCEKIVARIPKSA